MYTAGRKTDKVSLFVCFAHRGERARSGTTGDGDISRAQGISPAIATREFAEGIEIRVRDNGVGIPLEVPRETIPQPSQPARVQGSACR
jgi:signal transduction histidine kinase